ncbi:MAG TPA: ABC transporter ATP-binding protein [Tepidisphaeraceae bacterium]|nr:ABC transporter ATP-binding protein [Tepidisphaeraceae bacterium]
MSQSPRASSSPSKIVSAEGESGLPANLKGQLNGQLTGQSVVAWSEFDIDARGRYQQQYVVLTERQLLIFSGSAPASAVDIATIESAKIAEGMGVDRLNVIVGDKLLAELRYTKAHRRGMTKVHRKLERRLPSKQSPDEMPPEWLEQVEREAEKNEHCAKCGQLIPSYAEGVCPNCLQSRAILWRLIDVAKPYRSKIWIALSLTLVVAAMAVVPPYLTKRIVNDIEAGREYSNILRWCGLMAIAIVITESISAWRLLILSRVGTTITGDLRHMVYAHLHDLSLRYFAKRRTGSLITRVTNDTERLWDFIVFGSVNLIRDVAMIFFISAIMFWTNWRLAAVTLAPVPVLAIITYYRGKKMQRMFGRMWTYWSRLTGVVGDALPGVKVVKAFANEGREIERFDRRSNEFTAKEQEIHGVWTGMQALVSGLMRLGALIVWAVGGYLVLTNTSGQRGFDLGTLVMFTALVWQFYQPVMELANSNRMVTRAATSAQRVFEVLDTPPEIYSREGALSPDKLEGRVEFKQVSFSYEGTAPALREVSMVVEPREMIGLCGPSGAGKSTFVNLISRFYDPTDGQILLDGRDLRDYDVRWLRRQVGMVLQEPYLFHGTISDNIRYGNPDAGEAQIVAAAKAANAHDFVVGFPDGYDTMVGERGQSLSGGERQRISIARAILHNPRILILDEATSSVDTETEKQIQQALDRLVEGRTTIAIAHRLSTLQAADRLVVLEKGRVAEQGLHEELVDKPDGVYAKLHRTQAEMNAQVAIR